MAVNISQTPNPNALKYEVGASIDSPTTFVAGKDTDDPMAAALLELPGVTSVFMMADFVTISKSPDASWDGIAMESKRILEEHFGD